MSKLLVQSRYFLPMVIKKRLLETSPILETLPTVASKLDVPSKKESPETKPLTKKEDHKEETIKILLQTNIAHSKDFPINKVQQRTLEQALMASFLPMVIKKSPLQTSPILETLPTIASKLDVPFKKESPETKPLTEKEDHKEETIKILLQTNIAHSKDFPINKVQQRTLEQALMADVMQVQCWLTKVLARGHMWVFRKEQGIMRGLAYGPTPGPTMVILEGLPRAKEEEPNSILPEHSKNEPMKQKHSENNAVKKGEAPKKSDKKSFPMKSSFMETLLKHEPELQRSISAKLGSMWKKVVEKLPK